jgi:hypothetical protein
LDYERRHECETDQKQPELPHQVLLVPLWYKLGLEAGDCHDSDELDEISGCRGAMRIAGGMWRVKREPFCLLLGAAEAF